MTLTARQKDKNLYYIWRALLVAGVDNIFPVRHSDDTPLQDVAYRRLTSTQKSTPWDPYTNIADAVNVAKSLGIEVTTKRDHDGYGYLSTKEANVDFSSGEDIFSPIMEVVCKSAVIHGESLNQFDDLISRATKGKEPLSLLDVCYFVALNAETEFAYQKICRIVSREDDHLSERYSLKPRKSLVYRFSNPLSLLVNLTFVLPPNNANDKFKVVRVMDITTYSKDNKLDYKFTRVKNTY